MEDQIPSGISFIIIKVMPSTIQVYCMCHYWRENTRFWIVISNLLRNWWLKVCFYSKIPTFHFLHPSFTWKVTCSHSCFLGSVKKQARRNSREINIWRLFTCPSMRGTGTASFQHWRLFWLSFCLEHLWLSTALQQFTIQISRPAMLLGKLFSLLF